MMTMSKEEIHIPKETVLTLCEEIRTNHQKTWFPFGIGKMQCWGCWRFGKKVDKEGNISNICAFNPPANRGCWQINKLYDRVISSQ
jgi:hypothetical protein